jgi:hypothetical protein
MHEENPEHVELLLGEYRLVHAVLNELAYETPDGHWAQRLTEALHTLREHMAKEQDGLFPAAVTTLSTAQWEVAERVRSVVGSVLSPAVSTS